MLAFSIEEAARYLETFKVYENKPASSIMEKVGEDYMAKFVDVLTSIRSVNKTDAGTLACNFGSLKALVLVVLNCVFYYYLILVYIC